MRFEDLYDDATLRAIDPRPRTAGVVPGPGTGGWRAVALAGALGLTRGLAEVFEGAEARAPVVEIRDDVPTDGGRIRLVLVPGAPALSRAFVRM